MAFPMLSMQLLVLSQRILPASQTNAREGLFVLIRAAPRTSPRSLSARALDSIPAKAERLTISPSCQSIESMRPPG